MRARNDVHRDQFTHALGCRRTGIRGSLHGPHVTPDHHGDVSSADLLLAEKTDVRSLDHGVGGLYGPDQPFGFDQPQCVLGHEAS